MKAYNNLLDKKGRDDRLTNSTLKMLIKIHEFWGKENQVQEYHEMLSAMNL